MSYWLMWVVAAMTGSCQGGGEMKNGDCAEMAKEVVDPDKGKQVVVMKPPPSAAGVGGAAAAGEEVTAELEYEHLYPAPGWNYQDVVQDRKLFMETLGKLHAAMGTKFMIPTIGGKELDLHRLFVETTARGGIEKAIGDRRWREVTAVFSFPSTATNASYVVRKYYMSLLKHYERLYFFRLKGWNSPPIASSATPLATLLPAERSADSAVQPSSSTPNVRKRRSPVDVSAAGLSAPGNRSIIGVIDGKIENGYLVTVTVGAQNLRGVVFHTHDQTAANQAADNSDVKVVRRRRRRKKLSKRDPTHPKPNRSGYNFFFAEQHARLKPLHPGRDREISKIIGDRWNKLTETEKAVYQDKGVQDKERYRSEMAVYRERLKTGQVISNAVPIQQRPAEPVVPMVNVVSKMEIDEADLPEADDNGGSSDDTSDSEDKKSEEESELETSPEVGAVPIGSAAAAADPSTEADGFELRRRAQVQAEAEAEHPSSGEDTESMKVAEPIIHPQ